jgi:hypothetical protein
LRVIIVFIRVLIVIVVGHDWLASLPNTDHQRSGVCALSETNVD